MKLSAFMNVYKIRKSNDEREKLVKEHIKDDYVPYDKKADIAKAIADNCYWDKMKTEDGKEHKELHVDSVAKYMLTCISLVDLYTDIERQKGDGKMLEDFNTLNRSGILDYIIKNIDKRELKEFNMVLQMTCEDIITNEYENHAFIAKQVNRFGDLISASLVPVLSQIDINKINDMIGEMKTKNTGMG